MKEYAVHGLKNPYDMRMQWFRLVLFPLILMMAFSAQAVELRDISVDAQGEKEQVHITMDAPYPPLSVFTLNNPPRVVIDVPAMENPEAIALPSRYRGEWIQRIRGGQFNPTTTRIVLDVNRPMSVSHTVGSRDNALTIEITPKKNVPEGKKRDTEAKSPLLVYSNVPKVQVDTKPYDGFLTPKRKPDREDRMPIIVIDAGHGGRDGGAQGVRGTREKNVTLLMANKLGAALEKTGDFRVIYTRTDDAYLLLKERVAIARAAHGDVFLSLHADANPSKDTRGFSVYSLSEDASDAEAAALAAQENKADIIDGVDLSSQDEDVTGVLIDLMQRETNNTSSKLAEVIIQNMPKSVKGTRNTHRFAGFRVLKAPDIPSVLIEMGFLTNAEDERLLKNLDYQEAFIAGIVAGVEQFVQ